jgi:tetratricopeptide (TPR) repeat protein
VSSIEGLQKAIEAARGGRRIEARDLLIQMVEVDPQNEMAWVWLSGLVDSLEDRIIACENALTINPANQKVRAYLNQLQREQKSLLENKDRDNTVDLLNRAKIHAKQNEKDIALRLVMQALDRHDDMEEAWLLLGQLSSNVDHQIEAFEKVYRINPSNKESSLILEQLRVLKTDPIGAARRFEQLGKFEEALHAYREAAGKARNSREFDHVYKQILRLEGLQNEKIRYVAPSSSITRLTFTWPLLYLSFALVQVGLNPFAHPVFYLWLGLPPVVAGSFLLSLAEVRSEHIVWQKLFEEQGDGSQFARGVTASAGWIFIIVPHILLFLDSWNRLQNFTVPPMPF